MYGLKKLLYDECIRYKMPDELLDRFIGIMTEVHLKNRQALIPYGAVDANVYVQKSGITRVCWFDGEREKTYGFSSPGTVIISYHPHAMHLPSSFQYESCGESVVMKAPKREFDELVAGSHEFARWVLAIHLQQLYFNELKYTLINGSAKERYLSLVKNRPDIIKRVSSKVIASYIGVTTTYLSDLKKSLREQK